MLDEQIFQMNVVKAMHRIEHLYEQTNGRCYLGFSGGKDSTVVLHILKLCQDLGTIPEETIPALFCDTKIELDATYQFVSWCKENLYRNIEILQPAMPFGHVIKQYGKPIKSKMRSKLLRTYQNNPNTKAIEYLTDKKWRKTCIANKDLHMIHPNFEIRASMSCCEELKKKPFKRYAKDNEILGYMTGERLAEGGVRSVIIQRNIDSGNSPCTRISGKFIVKMPIVDWSDEMIDMFIERYNVKLSDAYTVYGLTRTGCCCCPYSKNIADDLKVLFAHEPNKYKASMFWLKDVYIAQNVMLPFDEEYEQQRKQKWKEDYTQMRYDMLKQYRPDCRLCKQHESTK